MASYDLEYANSLGEVKIVFNKPINWKKTNINILNVTGNFFRVAASQNYQDFLKAMEEVDERNLNISNYWITDYGFNYIKFLLNFTNVNNISQGGIEHEDDLFYLILSPQLLKFETQQEYNAMTNNYDEY